MSLKIALGALLLLLPLKVNSQNWMMAQMYAQAALDSVMNSTSEGAENFSLCEYSYFKYNPGNQMYSLYLSDYLQDTSFVSVITVRLNGGNTVFLNDDLQTFGTTLPDWSDNFYLYNNTGKKISYALSCDDSGFSTYSLDANKFEKYTCNGSNYMYIKISTLIDGVEKAQVHYKLLKGRGYKVEWDADGNKFEVYSDDRLK